MTDTNSLTNSIVNFICNHNGFAFRVNTMGVPRKVANGKIIFSPSKNKGVSDIIACVDGNYISIEIKMTYKKGKDKLSPEQKLFRDNIEFCKGEYWVIKNFDEFINHWNNFLKQIK